jgi:hypothetical protein
MEYYFQGTDSLRLQAGLGWLWTWQIVKSIPLTFHFGVDANAMSRKGTFANSTDSAAVFFNVPIGMRYSYQLNEKTIIGPEFMYVLGHDVDQFAENSMYMRFGINARWRMLQGGVFYNTGKAINYLGFRAGIAL